MYRGFILQPTYRIEAGRPVVLLHGKLESGKSFLVRERRQIPRFFIHETDAARARELGAEIQAADRERTTMLGNPVVPVHVAQPQETPALRDRLIREGVPCFEADVRFAQRYLIDRGIRASLEIRGTPQTAAGIGAVFDDPEVVPADWTPTLAVLSVDIETDPKASRVLSIALYGCGAAEVLLLVPPGMSCPGGAIACRNEHELLTTFVRRVIEIDPDVLTGWNFIDFDMSVLDRAAARVGVRFAIGRGAGTTRIRPSSFPRGSSQASVPGRLVLDGIEMLRGAFVKVESYGLNSVAQAILGRGKTISGGDRAEEILEAFHNQRERFVEYNLNDAKLVLEIFDELRLIDLAIERSRLTGMPPDRVAASIAAFDFLYLSALTRRNIVAPTVGATGREDQPTSGGHVLAPLPGLYRNVLVFDFKSLYPSIIRTFQIDPLGLVPPGASRDGAIVAPNGAAFRREPGILPGLLDDLFPRREAAKREGNKVASEAIKILMNSFYGVLGTSACRFADPLLANAITGFGREILLWTQALIERNGFKVLYGDTDSLFALAGVDDATEARTAGAELVQAINRELGEHISNKWRVESRLELEFERLYLRLLLPALRHGRFPHTRATRLQFGQASAIGHVLEQFCETHGQPFRAHTFIHEPAM